MHRIVDAVSGRPLVARVELARGLGLRAARGLIGRRGLGPGEGLLLADPLGCVHTCGMRFPIDVVFLDRRLVVVGVAEAVPPWRLAARRGARLQLELSAGRACALGLVPGSRLALRPAGGPFRAGSPRPVGRSGEPAHEPAPRPCATGRDVPSVPPRSAPRTPPPGGAAPPPTAPNPFRRSV
ncbi:MAG: DUF192 domain-containing protein [Actinobacteria bacterium]|nr:DUF192 domain-containing protein [Actinomycetota bacterium]